MDSDLIRKRIDSKGLENNTLERRFSPRIIFAKLARKFNNNIFPKSVFISFGTIPLVSTPSPQQQIEIQAPLLAPSSSFFAFFTDRFSSNTLIGKKNWEERNTDLPYSTLLVVSLNVFLRCVRANGRIDT